MHNGKILWQILRELNSAMPKDNLIGFVEWPDLK